MLQSAAVILVFQWLGETLTTWLALPIPGPVAGMLLLLVALVLRGRELPAGMLRIGEAVQRHLSLLFIPAGVGLMGHYGLIRAEWAAIAAALFFSTLAALVITVLVMRRTGKAAAQEGSGNAAD